ncbi:hypothetical protein [Crenothrix sp.]|uniref:hypothetical protein n=1 Tax=Crenothrix sp. TaxID=3100433 RepID=UPI00374D62B4
MGNAMRGKGILLFMWGYQEHYRFSVGYLAKQVFETLGISIEPKALVVGVRRPESKNRNKVCVEPENGEWSIDLFSGLLDRVEDIFEKHPSQNIIYGDDLSMREKPEHIRRDSVSSAVGEALKPYDDKYKVRSFCGVSYPVDEYYVVPVIQVPEGVFEQYPPLHGEIRWHSMAGYSSFIHAAISMLLAEATGELKRPDSGRGISFGSRPEELTYQTAKNFLRTFGILIKDSNCYLDMLSQLNLVSSLMYERAEGKGRLLLVNPENPAIDYRLHFIEPVPFNEPRWARKILQMASQDIMLIADCEKIHGLGKLNENHDATQQDAFIVDFLDHYHWQLRCGEQVLIQSEYGKPSLPKEVISRDRFLDNYSRLFPQTSSEQQNHIWQLFNFAIKQNHGSSLIIANDAESEAERLARQGTTIKPVLMTTELFQRVSGIDGTIILDPFGICHAIGVILDGFANEQCTPSRGSRFNSGVRYVEANKKQRLAIVVSDDKMVDIFPLLRPRIEKAKIIQVIEQLEQATEDNYHKPRNWLDEHRFYLDAEQCECANTALTRIKNLPQDVSEIRYLGNSFEPHPDMEDSYFLPTTGP